MEPVTPVPPARRLFWPTPVTWTALFAGVLATTSLPPVRGTAPLMLLALMLLFHLLRIAERPGRTAWWFALAHQATLLYWLFFLDPAKSIPTRALVPLQAVATIVFCAAHYLLMGWVAGKLRRRFGREALLAALPVLWTATELLRTVGEMGFPWCLSGAVWLDTPLAGLYPASGEIGVGAATGLTAAALLGLVDLVRGVADSRGRALRLGLASAAALGWMALLGGARVGREVPLPDGWREEPLPVAAVQANVALKDKWAEARRDSTILPYTELTGAAVAAGARLVIWPETAVPAYLRYDADYLQWVRGLVREMRTPLFAGFPDARRDETTGELLKFNSSGLFDRTGTLRDRYSKHHLLPIGEAMPFQGLLPFLGGIDVGQAEWTPGAPPGPITVTTPRGAFPFAPLICYEAIFGDLARQAVNRGAGCLVNITNDGWFGPTSGPRQHYALSRIRAAECRTTLVRCANNGISAIVGPDGRPREELWLNRRGFVLRPVQLTAARTLYVRAGVWPAVAFLLVWAAAGLGLARRAPETDA